MNKLHRNITVSGMVQGVGFRYACLHAARSMGIKGFVKNLTNGKVYIEAEGSEFQIKVFLKWCNEGPSHAYVNNISTNSGDVIDYSFFEIKH